MKTRKKRGFAASDPQIFAIIFIAPILLIKDKFYVTYLKKVNNKNICLEICRMVAFFAFCEILAISCQKNRSSF